MPTQMSAWFDLTFTPKRDTSVEEVNKLLKDASTSRPACRGARLHDEPIVSIDLNGAPASSTVDSLETAVLEGKLVRVVSWYDNEWGFSNRMVDTAGAIAKFSEHMGILAGIARHDRPKGAMETRDVAEIAPGEGVRGDFRGALKPGRNKREVTMMAIEDWRQAADEVGKPWLDWFDRRANLLTEGVALPRTPGARIRIGEDALLEVTGETEPCERMEALSPGCAPL